MDRERVFAVLFGIYAGCLLGPATWLVAPGPTWPVTFAGFAVAATASYLLTQNLDLAVNLTGVWRNLSLVVFPFVYLPRLLARLPVESPTAFATPAAVGLFAVGPGLLAIGVAHSYRNAQTLSEATVDAEFTARSAPRSRKLQYVGGGMVVLSGLVGGLLFLFADGNVDSGSLVSYFTAVLGGLTPIVATSGDREVAITDAGLKVQMQVHDWDTFTDYEITDDALVLERPKRRHATFKFDREDVENLSEVEEALKRYLPRE